MSGTATEKKGASIRILPDSLYVCRRPADGTATKSATLAIGAQLLLRVEDAITGKAVKGTLAKRIKIDSQGPTGKVDWVDCDAEYHLPSPVPKWARKLSSAELKKLKDSDAAIKKILALPKDKQKAKATELANHQKEKQKLVTKDADRKAWVGYLQSGLKLLGQYDGPLDGEMSPSFASHLVKTYKKVTGNNYSAASAAGGLFEVIKKRYATDDKGNLPIPLPLGEKGVVEVEFLHFKAVDPAEFEKLGLSDADLTSSAVYRGSGFSDPADQPGSSSEQSGWAYITGKGEIRFRNFIKVKFETPDEVPKEPLKARTRAMVWCQPAFTLTDKKFIWDPATGTRGHPNRGTVDTRPTTLVCTKGMPSWSKKYGEYGNQGRKDTSTGTWRWHVGVDLAGKEGDPLFALNGGKVKSTGKDSIGGRRVKVVPWIFNDPIQIYTLRHLVDDSPTVKVGQIVKAGDIVGKMGRTGSFPGVSPTHVHFDCVLNIQSNSSLASFLEQGYKAVFPNNQMPKILPCGEEYKGLATWQDPVGCDAERDHLANTCWALRELACPFVPADKSLKVEDGDLANNNSKKAARKVQAQLLQLHENNEKNGSTYENPGAIDGKLGLAEAFVTVRDDRIHRTVWDATQQNVIFKADANEKFEQVELDASTKRHKVKLSADQVTKYKGKAKKAGVTLTAGIRVFIHQSQVTASLPGSTRKAVKKFRDATIDKKRKLDPPGCYRIDQDVVDELEKLAPLKLETPA